MAVYEYQEKKSKNAYPVDYYFLRSCFGYDWIYDCSCADVFVNTKKIDEK